MLTVLVADKFEKAGLDGLRALGCRVVFEPECGSEGIGPLVARESPDVLIVRSTKVPASAMGEARPGRRGLRLIVRAGAGVDNIDVPAASERGIAVCNCPGMNAAAVAELTFAHLLCCDRRVVDQTNELRAGRWNKKEFARARGLKGLCLGVVGLGAIGEAVIRRALAFDMRVLAWSRSLTPERARGLGAEFGGQDRASLLAMLPRCDAVTIHVALAPETKRLCDAAFFGAMNRGAYFINTSRGAVVDEGALRDAIRGKGIRAGLDVYENQPATPEGAFDCPTAALPGVTCTHHVGASTDQAQRAVADETVRVVRVFMESGRFENCVNASAVR